MANLSSGANRWVVCLHQAAEVRERLICFPPAGAGANHFRGWVESLPSHVSLYGVQLPGRGERMHEPPVRELAGVVDAVVAGLRPLLDVPCTFLGHSLGSLIAFCVARSLRLTGSSSPKHLVLAAYPAPHLPRTDSIVSELPVEAFLRELVRLGGMPPELVEHKELMEMIMPALRADFALDEGYRYEAQAPLCCGISACGGTTDPDVTREQLEGWRDHTSGSFDLTMFSGGHFFISEHRKEVLDVAFDGQDADCQKL